jgi:hypothetical protein
MLSEMPMTVHKKGGKNPKGGEEKRMEKKQASLPAASTGATKDKCGGRAALDDG